MTASPHFSAPDLEILRLTGISEDTILDPASSVYSNRDLDLSQIKLVGFDMDYTLAVYQKQSMEKLQYALTVEKLINSNGYPLEIRTLLYDPNLIIRGLVVDKKRGHLLKMDTHGRVWRAMHGRRHLSPSEINEIYANRKIRVGTPQYASLDTFFAMPEACLYSNLIDFFQAKLAREESIGELSGGVSDPQHEGPINTVKLFDDVRSAIDQIHSDDSLKSIITDNLSEYLSDDDDTALVLHKLRSVGKKLFLLTNSYWEYTDRLMTFLLANKLAGYDSWKAYFDVIIVGAQKPAFFTQKNPFVDIRSESEVTQLDRYKVYRGGNISDFERMIGCRGEEILYVGDHIYGDIVRSKKESLWRTCLVVEELPSEIQLAVLYAHELDKISEMSAERLEIDTLIGRHRSLLAHVDARLTSDKSGHSKEENDLLHEWSRIFRREIDSGKKFVRDLDQRTLVTLNELELRFHPHWGRTFREHNELSRFGAQVKWYACIYTGKLTNLLQYSPLHIFKATTELMCHDRVIQNTMPVRKARVKT